MDNSFKTILIFLLFLDNFVQCALFYNVESSRSTSRSLPTQFCMFFPHFNWKKILHYICAAVFITHPVPVFLDVCLSFGHSYSLLRDCTGKEKPMTLLHRRYQVPTAPQPGVDSPRTPCWDSLSDLTAVSRHVPLLCSCSCPPLLILPNNSLHVLEHMSSSTSCLSPSWRRPLLPVYLKAFLVLGTQNINNDYLI